MIKYVLFILFTFKLFAQTTYQVNMPGAKQDPSKLNLSDQDRFIMKNFRSKTNDLDKCIKEAKGDSSLVSICRSDQDTKSIKVLGIDSDMMKLLPLFYSKIVGDFGDGKFTPRAKEADASSAGKSTDTVTPEAKAPKTKVSDTKPDASGDNATEEDKKSNDYCRYIPMAGEALSLMNYSNSSKPIQANQKRSTSKQVDSLYNAAREHENRASAAEVQTATWGAGLACYTAYGLTGAASFSDNNYLIKLGGSALFTTYYATLVSKHKSYAQKLKAMARKMPGLGDCNPITDNACYCSLPVSEIDVAKYCLPKQSQNIKVLDGYLGTCIDSNLKDDPNCNCARTNSCYDKIFASQFDSLPYTSAFGNSPAGVEFKNLTKGKISPARMRASNNALRALKKMNLSKIPGLKKPLTRSQNKVAATMAKIGIPPRLAALLATTPFNSSAKKYASKFKGYAGFRKYRGYRKSRRGSNSKIYRYQKSRGKSSSRKSRSSFNMNKFLKKKKKGNNSKIYRFARKAEARAQINQDSSKPIFEIISRRYKITAWKSLEWE